MQLKDELKIHIRTAFTERKYPREELIRIARHYPHKFYDDLIDTAVEVFEDYMNGKLAFSQPNHLGKKPIYNDPKFLKMLRECLEKGMKIPDFYIR